MTIAVTLGSGLLSAAFAWGSSSVPATLRKPSGNGGAEANNTAVLAIPRSLHLPCLLTTELAWDGETVVFNFTDGTLELPGLLSATFVRQSADAVAMQSMW